MLYTFTVTEDNHKWKENGTKGVINYNSRGYSFRVSAALNLSFEW